MNQFLPDMLEQYFYWINERHSIYLKRLAGHPWPWTEDEILQKYKFTNPFRENDAGTVWLRDNWRIPYANHSELFFNICMYRQFNLIATAEAIGFVQEWDPDHVDELLHQRRQQGFPIFTNAHMLTGMLHKDKIVQAVWKILTPLWDDIDTYCPQPDDTLESAFKKLLPAPGFGKFIAYEVVSDLRWTRYLENAADIMTWANPGPGAMRGIARLFGIPIKASIAGGNYGFTPKQHIGFMQQLLEISDEYLEDHVPDFEMRDIEHSLCEFDKYMRVKTGQGRPRMKFIPPHLRK